jgi:hypothetical protein
MKQQTKELREQRKAVGDGTDQNARQLEGFQALRRLLAKKKESQTVLMDARAAEAKREQAEAQVASENLVLDGGSQPSTPAAGSRNRRMG